MKYIHFVNVQEPGKTLVAVDYGRGYYECEIPYIEEDGSIRTQTHAISQSTVDYMTGAGAWKIIKINGAKV